MLLFVYGTLKRGQRNHRLLADQRFVGPAVTAPAFRLFDLGPHPAMVRDADGGAVRGELFAVSECCLGELDEFEGVPDLFDRERIGLADGTTAWAYLYVRPIPDGTPSGEEWPFG
jgi:gamma-glutamylaminecyclotransferase